MYLKNIDFNRHVTKFWLLLMIQTIVLGRCHHTLSSVRIYTYTRLDNKIFDTVQPIDCWSVKLLVLSLLPCPQMTTDWQITRTFPRVYIHCAGEQVPVIGWVVAAWAGIQWVSFFYILLSRSVCVEKPTFKIYLHIYDTHNRDKTTIIDFYYCWIIVDSIKVYIELQHIICKYPGTVLKRFSVGCCSPAYMLEEFFAINTIIF